MNNKSFRYEQVAKKIEESIHTLGLRPGDKIASVRQVSREMKVSVNTVFQAYSILEAKGLIYARPKSGYVVNLPHSMNGIEQQNYRAALPAEVEITAMAATMMKNAREHGIMNFSILAPVNELLPITRLNKQVASALNDSQNENYQYPLIDGHPRLLKQIARRTIDWPYSLKVDQILVTNGCMEAINLCLDALTKPGDIIAVESPTYHGILQSLEQRGLKALEILTDPATGLSLDALRIALDQYTVTACVFMPCCHNPIGCAMPESYKIELINMLAERNIPLIEDHSLGELNFDDAHLPAKAYDQHDNVLLCGSFSKTLAPGFRIGWVSAGKYHRELEKLKFGSNISTGGVFQDALGRFLESGLYEKHLKKIRSELQRQMIRYINAISTYFPKQTAFAVPQGGLSIWLELPPGKDAYMLQKAVLNKGIGICPGHIFSASDRFHQYIRINYCPLWTFKVEQAIREIAVQIEKLD